MVKLGIVKWWAAKSCSKDWHEVSRIVYTFALCKQASSISTFCLCAELVNDIPTEGCFLMSSRPALRPWLASAKHFSHVFNDARRRSRDTVVASMVVKLSNDIRG